MGRLRHRLYFKNENEENIKKKRGFTLVELLAVIAIIGLIGSIVVVSVVNIINNSKENATVLAINNVKSAAELYSKENSSEIKWIGQYDNNGTIQGRFVCMTVRQLINNGYFDEKFFDKDIYHDRINDNTFIEIKQGTNADNTNVIIHDSDSTQKDCEMSAINTTLGEIELEDKESYTDRINISVKPKSDEINPDDVDFFASYDKDGEEVPGICTNGDCSFNSLKDDTNYKIKVCMQPKASNTTLTSTVCNTFEQPTKSFNPPTITIEKDKKWANSKKVTITYDDTGIYNEEGLHYFKSEVTAKVISNNVLKCSDNKDGQKKNCNDKVTNIEENTWYMVENNDNKVSFEVSVSIITPKVITGRIQDQTGNYLDSKKNLTRIDSDAPICIVSGGSTTWVNKNVSIYGECKDSGSGCTKNKITQNITSTTDGGAISPGTVYDKAGNSTKCSGVIVKVDKTKPTCTVTGGSTTWINSKSSTKSRTITAKCTDKNSGCDTANFSKTYSGNMNISDAGALGRGNGGKVYDKAGNVTNCPANQVVKIDTSIPNCNVSGGSRNWTKNDVIVNGTCSDSGGSQCKGNISKKINYNHDGNVSPGTVYDNAGNSRTCGNVMVKVDKNAPSCSVSGGSSNWRNSDVTIYGTCSDSGGSDCQGNVSKYVPGNYNGNVSPGTVYDKAGNYRVCNSTPVKIDKNAPSCSVSGGSSGWTKNDVTVTGTCDDSGGSQCRGNVSYNISQTFNGNVSPGSVCDYANNCTACDSVTVQIDKNEPNVGEITKSKTKPTGHGCANVAEGHNSYFYFKISDNESGLKNGRFRWSTTDKINAGNSIDRYGSQHWECIGTSASNKKELDLKYKVCDQVGNCKTKNW